MPRTRNTTFVSIAISFIEKRKLDWHARREGIPRNRLIRNWIATLDEPSDDPDF